MENKYNSKSQNSNNSNNNNNNKYMDHMYCHTNPKTNSYNNNSHHNVTSGGGGGGPNAASPNADILALLKENKQLKAMLILHLDLIQEQSDQIMAKEKLLITQNDDIDTLRARTMLLENQVKDLQKQLQRQIKRSGEISSLPPPPLAKIQCKTNAVSSPVVITAQPPASSAPSLPRVTVATAAAAGSLPDGNLVSNNTVPAAIVEGSQKSNIIGECNGKPISKIVLQRVSISTPRGARRKHRNSPHATDTENDDEDGDEDEADLEEEDDELEDNEMEEEIEEEDYAEDEAEDILEQTLQQQLLLTQKHDEEEEEQECQRRFIDDDDDEDDVEEILNRSQESVYNRTVAADNDEKSNSQPVVIDDDMDDTGNTTEDSNEVLAVQSKRIRLRQAAKLSLGIPRGAKPGVSPASIITHNDGQTAFKAVTATAVGAAAVAPTAITHISVTPPTPSRGKQMTIMRWHAPDYHTDDTASCDSMGDTVERRSTSAASCSPPKPTASNITSSKNQSKDNKRASSSSHHASGGPTRPKMRRCAYISTPHLYSCREWEDEAFNCDDYEFIKAEAKALQSDAPMLEIPKWTEHELTPSYCIEGTEDLSDETFLKRHGKWEVDERRRKKWDVQQIREQRRIEKLKRRHCKEELQAQHDASALQSFYPTIENLQSICFVHDLPVQAFGEMIPKLSPNHINLEHRNFLLPWLADTKFGDGESGGTAPGSSSNKLPTVVTLQTTNAITTLSQAQHQQLNSTFVFLKKRRRQQSSSAHATLRQRSQLAKARAAAAKAEANKTNANTILNSSTTTTTSASINVTSTAALDISVMEQPQNTITPITTTTSTISTTSDNSTNITSNSNSLSNIGDATAASVVPTEAINTSSSLTTSTTTTCSVTQNPADCPTEQEHNNAVVAAITE